MVLLGLAASAVSTRAAFAWGATGHEWISGLAVESLPDELPAFIRTPAAVARIALLGRELDRSKGAGKVHDRERDRGHFISLRDDASVFGLPLENLPPTREEYDGAMRARGSSQYRAGYLPYAIVDGWQQLQQDFAYWRADVAGARTAADAAERAWFDSDRALREMLILRDLGIWSHYLGDASQPLHVTIHYAGWGNYPNPGHFTAPAGFASFIEGAFVRENVDRGAVKGAMAPYRACGCTIEERVRILVLGTHAQVAPLYALEKQGGFSPGNAAGTQFAVALLAAGSAALRDMIIDAWRTSVDMDVGDPPIRVRDIEAGRRILRRRDFGND